MKTSAMFLRNYMKAIGALGDASDFYGESGIEYALRHIEAALKEILFVKNELESNKTCKGGI